MKLVFFFQAEDGIRDIGVTGVQTCALPIYRKRKGEPRRRARHPDLHGTRRGLHAAHRRRRGREHHVRRGEGADPGDRYQARARRRRGHIMAQFLFEAMTIAVSGGLVGLATAALIVFGVDAIPTQDNPAMQYILNPRLSWPIAFICVGILLAVGLTAGILPARRAAAVDPVESLRYA